MFVLSDDGTSVRTRSTLTFGYNGGYPDNSSYSNAPKPYTSSLGAAGARSSCCGLMVNGEPTPAFAAGSYVIVQKYLHDVDGWNALSTEAQERIIGRTKLSDIELDDAVKPTSAHNALTTIEEDGKEIKILRDNMPFGRVAEGEFGTYFIGYSRSPRTIEQMLQNMFVGRPPGNYDRLLDFSRAVTGGLFFVPSEARLEALAEQRPSA